MYQKTFHMLSHSSELINHTWHAYLIFILLAVWFVLNVLLCVCSSSHVHVVVLWLLCGSTDWKTGKWRETQNSIHWHQIRSGKIFRGKRKALHDICSNVRDVLVLNCFLLFWKTELLIILLWDPCFLHDTYESLFEMNLSYLICTVLCWTPFFSIVCWYVHWSCWKRLNVICWS